MSRSTTRSAAGFTGRSSPSSPSKHRTRPRRRQRSLRIERHRRRGQHRPRTPLIQRPSAEQLTAAKAPTTTACWPRLKFGPGESALAGGLSAPTATFRSSPSQRGPVDVASNVHSQNALVSPPRLRPAALFVRASGFNESRHNGTPYQFNATRLIRYATGGDWQGPQHAYALRLYGSDERYRQTFSSISNLPNRRSHVHLSLRRDSHALLLRPRQRARRAAHWSQPLRRGPALVAGADAHDVRVWDREQTYGRLRRAHQPRTTISATPAAYAEAMWEHKRLDLVASGRMDWFQNYDGHKHMERSTWRPTAAAVRNQMSAYSIRASASRASCRRTGRFGLGFRAFRAPTPSELYRSTQVGNQLTFPTAICSASAPPGWEAGLAAERSWGSIRSSYFLTQVNRPIVAVTINPTSSPILLMRENLGQIESRGVSLDYELAPRSLAGRRRRLPVRPRRGLARHAGSAIGFPKSPAIWLRSTCAHPARRSEPSASKAVSAAASSTTTPTPISSTATSASIPSKRRSSCPSAHAGHGQSRPAGHARIPRRRDHSRQHLSPLPAPRPRGHPPHGRLHASSVGRAPCSPTPAASRSSP
jgi:hypothetical protein